MVHQAWEVNLLKTSLQNVKGRKQDFVSNKVADLWVMHRWLLWYRIYHSPKPVIFNLFSLHGTYKLII